jgi:DNA-directed RNA polymerase III subunit RPC1
VIQLTRGGCSVKKIGSLKLLHERYGAPEKGPGGALTANAHQAMEFRIANELVQELAPHLHKAHDDLNPLRVLRLFQAMSDDDCLLLGLSPATSRPELLLMTQLPVPPACLRPTVTTDASQGITEDDLTMQLSSIVQISNGIGREIGRGSSTQALYEDWSC